VSAALTIDNVPLSVMMDADSEIGLDVVQSPC
jgi:hypothetical protein